MVQGPSDHVVDVLGYRPAARLEDTGTEEVGSEPLVAVELADRSVDVLNGGAEGPLLPDTPASRRRLLQALGRGVVSGLLERGKISD